MQLEKHNKYYETLKDTKKYKTYYLYDNNNVFTLPNDIKLLLMSDLHTATTKIIDDLIKIKKICKNTIVISTGDMAGNGKIGGNGDPYPDYLKIKNTAYSFYFVQGNHDIFNKKCRDLQNDDGTFCHVEGKIQQTVIGSITGLNGITTFDCRVDKKKHRFSEELYEKRLEYVLNLKPDILLTHQPLKKETLKKYYLPKIHLCGHYDINDFFQSDKDYTMINLDGKIMEFRNVEPQH